MPPLASDQQAGNGGPEVNLSDGEIRRRKRLGGLLSYYYREAA